MERKITILAIGINLSQTNFAGKHFLSFCKTINAQKGKKENVKKLYYTHKKRYKAKITLRMLKL